MKFCHVVKILPGGQMPADIQWYVCTLTKQPVGAQFESSCVVCKRPVFFSDTPSPAAKKICWRCWAKLIESDPTVLSFSNQFSLDRAKLVMDRN